MIGDTPTAAPLLEPDDTTAWILAAEEYQESDQFRAHAVDWAEGACPSERAREAVDTLLDEYARSLAATDVVRHHLDGDSQW